MFFKIDEHLRQFNIFANIEKLISGVMSENKDLITHIPGLNQLYAENMYSKWLTLAQLIGDSDNWGEEKWSNFTTSLTLAQMSKSISSCIYYALQAIGLNADDVKFESEDSVITKVYINILKVNNISNIELLKTELSSCLETLLLTIQPEVSVTVQIMHIDGSVEEYENYYLNNDIGYRTMISINSVSYATAKDNIGIVGPTSITLSEESDIYTYKLEFGGSSVDLYDGQYELSIIVVDTNGQDVFAPINVKFSEGESSSFTVGIVKEIWNDCQDFKIGIKVSTMYGDTDGYFMISVNSED